MNPEEVRCLHVFTLALVKDHTTIILLIELPDSVGMYTSGYSTRKWSFEVIMVAVLLISKAWYGYACVCMCVYTRNHAYDY